MKMNLWQFFFAFVLSLSACVSKTPEAAPHDMLQETPVNVVTEEVVASPIAEDHTMLIENTRTYILSGQADLPEAKQLHWSEAFLDNVDFATLCENYLASGGDENDSKSFAVYLTENVTVSSDWKTLFERDLWDAYQVKPERYEDLGNGLYQVYVKQENDVVPYVVVNSRTGWYHG